jgi:hypothetical protein
MGKGGKSIYSSERYDNLSANKELTKLHSYVSDAEKYFKKQDFLKTYESISQVSQLSGVPLFQVLGLGGAVRLVELNEDYAMKNRFVSCPGEGGWFSNNFFVKKYREYKHAEYFNTLRKEVLCAAERDHIAVGRLTPLEKLRLAWLLFHRANLYLPDLNSTAEQRYFQALNLAKAAYNQNDHQKKEAEASLMTMFHIIVDKKLSATEKELSIFKDWAINPERSMAHYHQFCAALATYHANLGILGRSQMWSEIASLFVVTIHEADLSDDQLARGPDPLISSNKMVEIAEMIRSKHTASYRHVRK